MRIQSIPFLKFSFAAGHDGMLAGIRIMPADFRFDILYQASIVILSGGRRYPGALWVKPAGGRVHPDSISGCSLTGFDDHDLFHDIRAAEVYPSAVVFFSAIVVVEEIPAAASALPAGKKRHVGFNPNSFTAVYRMVPKSGTGLKY